MALGKLFGRRKKAAPGSPETQPLHRAAEGQIKRFLGGAMHAYPLSKVKGNGCPRCGGALEQHRCAVAYMGAEEVGSVETTESWFCTACKSAVIDEKAVKRLAREQGDKYMAAIGLDVGKEDPAFFESWDGEGEEGGEKAGASDEDQMAKMMRAMFGMGGSDAEEAPAPGTAAKRQKRKQKRKQASKARKKNRRK